MSEAQDNIQTAETLAAGAGAAGSPSYLSAEMAARLEEARTRLKGGYAVLLDIISSTTRKQTQPNWQLHTEALYSAFQAFCDELAKELGSNNPVIKFVGDGLLAFFPINNGIYRNGQAEIQPKSACIVVRRVSDFRLHVHEVLAEQLGHLRLKCVLAHLDGIALIGGSKPTDVLGRGIDFLFRLEKYAASTHLVLNDSLAKACEQNSAWEKDGFELIPCERNIRGWEKTGAQSFFILASPESISEDPPSASLNDEHVSSELLSVLLRWRVREKVSAGHKPAWNSTPAVSADNSGDLV